MQKSKPGRKHEGTNASIAQPAQQRVPGSIAEQAIRFLRQAFDDEEAAADSSASRRPL